jgi:hypothetical protein
MIYRVDYIDASGKVRTKSFRIPLEAIKYVETLNNVGWDVVATSWERNNSNNRIRRGTKMELVSEGVIHEQE